MWGGQDQLKGRGEVSGRSKSRTERYTKRALFLTSDTVQPECVCAHSTGRAFSTVRNSTCEAVGAHLCILHASWLYSHQIFFLIFFWLLFSVYIK